MQQKMNKKRIAYLMQYLVVLVVVYISAGCTTTSPVVMLNNEAMPNKIYTITDAQQNISATAIFYRLTKVKDIEDTALVPLYLSLNDNIEMNTDESKYLFTRISVTNVHKIVYTINLYMSFQYSDGSIYIKNIHIGKSALAQRTFTVPVPELERSGYATGTIIVRDSKGSELFRIGDFKYTVYSPYKSR